MHILRQTLSKSDIMTLYISISHRITASDSFPPGAPPFLSIGPFPKIPSPPPPQPRPITPTHPSRRHSLPHRDASPPPARSERYHGCILLEKQEHPLSSQPIFPAYDRPPWSFFLFLFGRRADDGGHHARGAGLLHIHQPSPSDGHARRSHIGRSGSAPRGASPLLARGRPSHPAIVIRRSHDGLDGCALPRTSPHDLQV